MHKKVRGIAEVIPGYTFRGAIKEDREGNAFVFQAKDLLQGGLFSNASSLAPISFDAPEYRNFIRRGDVLILSRGMKEGSFRSGVFMSDLTNVVAASSVYIIRLKSSKVLPEYLCLYLNSREGQSKISEHVSGSYIGSLPRKKLEEIKIPIPSLNKQKTLVSLNFNIREQQRLLDRVKELKGDLIEAAMYKYEKYS